jgi:hypothetical protein
MSCLCLLTIFGQPPLHGSDAISKTEGNTLCFGADTNVPRQLAVIVILLFDGHIDQGVFSKDTVLCIAI